MEEKNKIELNDPEEDGSEKEREAGTGKRKRKRSHVIITFAMSLLASIVLWIVAVDYEVTDYEKTFTDINVYVKGKTELLGSKGMEVTYNDNFNLDITVSGKRSQLSTLKSSSFAAFVDVSGITAEGKTQLKLEVEPVNGITVVSQSISYLTVDVEKRGSFTFDIEVEEGEYSAGMDIELVPVLDKDEVNVTGSESVIQKIKRAVVYVQPEVNMVTEPFRSRCKIVLLDVSGNAIDTEGLTISPEYCDVNVGLIKVKEVPLDLKVTGGASIEYGVSFKDPEKASEQDYAQNPEFCITNRMIKISGEPKLIDSTNSLELEVSYEKIEKNIGTCQGSFVLTGKIIYPEGITPVNGEKELWVEVFTKESKTTVKGSDIHVLAVPEGYDVKVSDAEITLCGLSEEIDKVIASDNITVSVDLANESITSSTTSASVVIDIPYCVDYSKEVTVNIEFEEIVTVDENVTE